MPRSRPRSSGSTTMLEIEITIPEIAEAILHHYDLSQPLHDNLHPGWCSCNRSRRHDDGNTCSDCGGTMIRTGTCHTCTTCGSTGGCG